MSSTAPSPAPGDERLARVDRDETPKSIGPSYSSR
jgi:hypothetical protein